MCGAAQQLRRCTNRPSNLKAQQYHYVKDLLRVLSLWAAA
jgi:hypothetical protein